MKTCIFDLDGTLLNTIDDLANAVNYALRQNAMPEHTVDEVRWMVGNGVRTLMRRALPADADDELYEKAYADFQVYYKEHNLDFTRPYDGIIPLLAALKERGVKMAVVSNKIDTATKPLVKHFFGDYIDVAVGDTPDVQNKPAPDMVFKAIRELGETPENCIYIGDSNVDLETAQNAGLPCISVLWGFRDRKFLEGVGATMFAETPMEIVNML